jgi:hypothetical protein
VINASPLIYLGKLGLLPFLLKIFSKILTTERVKAEVLAHDQAAEIPALQAAFDSGIEVLTVSHPNPLFESLLKMNIHAGEAEVIVLASQQEKSEQRIILDDLDAREIAQSLGLKVTGTIGIIIALTQISILTPAESRQKLAYLLEHTSFRIHPLTIMKFEDTIAQIEKSK